MTNSWPAWSPLWNADDTLRSACCPISSRRRTRYCCMNRLQRPLVLHMRTHTTAQPQFPWKVYKRRIVFCKTKDPKSFLLNFVNNESFFIRVISFQVDETSVGEQPRLDAMVPAATVNRVVHRREIPYPSIVRLLYANSLLAFVFLRREFPINQRTIPCTRYARRSTLCIKVTLFYSFYKSRRETRCLDNVYYLRALTIEHL